MLFLRSYVRFVKSRWISCHFLNLFWCKLLLPLLDCSINHWLQTVPIHVWEVSRKVSRCHMQTVLEKRVEVVIQTLANCEYVSALCCTHQWCLSADCSSIYIYTLHFNQQFDKFMFPSSARQVQCCATNWILQINLRTIAQDQRKCFGSRPFRLATVH